jgi:hypothetical protein
MDDWPVAVAGVREYDGAFAAKASFNKELSIRVSDLKGERGDTDQNFTAAFPDEARRLWR